MPHLKPPELKEQQAARSMKRFDHRTVVVTGGARGMGASHARGFVAEGANVVIADVLEQEGRTLAHELGGDAIFSRPDLTSDKEWAGAGAAAAVAAQARHLAIPRVAEPEEITQMVLFVASDGPASRPARSSSSTAACCSARRRRTSAPRRPWPSRRKPKTIIIIPHNKKTWRSYGKQANEADE